MARRNSSKRASTARVLKKASWKNGWTLSTGRLFDPPPHLDPLHQTSAMPSDFAIFPTGVFSQSAPRPPTPAPAPNFRNAIGPFFRWALSAVFPTGASGRSAHLPPPLSIRSSRVHNVGKVIGNFNIIQRAFYFPLGLLVFHPQFLF